MKALKKIIGHFILMILGITIGLFLAEILVRVLTPQICIAPFLTPDFHQAHVLEKNIDLIDDRFPFLNYHIQTNSLGLRMPEIEDQKQNILCLGDSFTFGWGVDTENSFVGKLKEKLETQNADYLMINGGVPAYGTGHICSQMERLAKLFPFQKVIYFMNSNDVLDNLRTESYYRTYTIQESENGEISLEKVMVFTPLKRFLFTYTPYEWMAKNSHLFHFLKDFSVKKSTQKLQSDANVEKPQKIISMKINLAYLKLLVEKKQELGVEMMVIWIPPTEDLAVQNNQRWQKSVDFAAVKKAMSDFLESQNILFHDPTEKMNQQLQNGHFDLMEFFIEDEHFNEKGNLLFYESVVDTVTNFMIQK